MVQNQNIFQAYKPLRNNLRKLCLDDSLFVVLNSVKPTIEKVMKTIRNDPSK